MADRMLVVFIIIAAAAHSGPGFPVAGLSLNYSPGKLFRYSYITETRLNEARNNVTGQMRKSLSEKDVGFGISAVLELSAIWANKDTFLTRMMISTPKLHSIARMNIDKELYGLPKLPVFYMWTSGRVTDIYVAAEDSTLSVNIKKGIVSLFQLMDENGERQEVDSSGSCLATYQRFNTSLRKSKTSCQFPESATNHYTTANQLFQSSDVTSSVTDYVIDDDVIQTVNAVESHVTAVNMAQEVAASVESSQRLKMEGSSTCPIFTGATADDVIKELSKELNLRFYKTQLMTTFEHKQCKVDKCPELLEQVAKYSKQLVSGNMASVSAGAAFIDLVDAARISNKADLTTVLKSAKNAEILPALIDVIAAAQTADGRSVLMQNIDFRNEFNIEHAERYLLATAFATHPNQDLLNDLLKLYKESFPNEDLQESVAEALGAVVFTYSKLGNSDTVIVKTIAKEILSKLEGCSTSGCLTTHIRALGNAGLPDTIPRLIHFAQTATDPTVSEWAIKALRRMGKEQLQQDEIKTALKAIFHQKRRGFDSAVRTAALIALLDLNLNLEELREIFFESLDPYNTEYNSNIQARLLNTAANNASIRDFMKEIFRARKLRNYNVLAPKGKSLAFTGCMAKKSEISANYFMFVENGRSGIMKRSGMDVDVTSSAQGLPMYSFAIYAAGLEGLLGEEVEAGQEDAVATAGMSLGLMDVSLRPITFFTGQSGLMSAIWNAPSDLTSALQANILIQDEYRRIHLQNGLIVEFDIKGCLSLDLSGSMTISLWNKNGKTLVKNSGAFVLKGSMSIVTSSFRASLEFTQNARAIIDFQTIVDFYDGVKLCLQMSRPSVTQRHDVLKYERARGFKKGYVARINRTHTIPALSYPLPRRNNVLCRTMMSTAT